MSAARNPNAYSDATLSNKRTVNWHNRVMYRCAPELRVRPFISSSIASQRPGASTLVCTCASTHRSKLTESLFEWIRRECRRQFDEFKTLIDTETQFVSAESDKSKSDEFRRANKLKTRQREREKGENEEKTFVTRIFCCLFLAQQWSDWWIRYARVEANET